MRKITSAEIVIQQGQAVIRESIAATPFRPLEVNVIFTELQATVVALKSAESLAKGLGASIRVRAAIIVPVRLPLEHPPVSVSFMEQLLSELVSHPESDALEYTVHLYLCRKWVGTLLQILRPNSLVLIGGRKHWWPTPAVRLARALRAKGHRVTFVDVTIQTAGSLP
jgi:hypothetical protein